MRLLHTTTLELHSFTGKDTPLDAILSHTWGKDEFLFKDLQKGIHQHLQSPKRGLRKILKVCEQARRDHFDYVWVDTCCIDKSSSAELSEAINSMFAWYHDATICYAYMEDVSLNFDFMVNFGTSRWFTRGWILQELVAPPELVFFDHDWNRMRGRHEVTKLIGGITGISEDILLRRNPSRNTTHDIEACWGAVSLESLILKEPIAQNMKWAANRETSRKEDMAYCLMGLFGVNMPLLYGEGGENAFRRLQEEILRTFPDQSILTGALNAQIFDAVQSRPYLSTSPSAIRFHISPHDVGRVERGDIITTARGLKIDARLGPCVITAHAFTYPSFDLPLQLAVLSCDIEANYLTRVGILVKPLSPGYSTSTYARVYGNYLVMMRPRSKPQVIDLEINRSDGEEVSISCDLDKFELRRILLPAVQPPLTNAHITPQLNLEIQGCDDWQLKVKSPTLLRNNMALLRRGPITGLGFIGSTMIGGITFLSNGRSSFFVIWGIRNIDDHLDSPLPKPEYEFTCWTESWNSFMAGDLSRTATSDITREALKARCSDYIQHRESHQSIMKTEVSEGDFHAQARVDSFEFLGRREHTLTVNIQGWDKHPLLVLEHLGPQGLD